MIKKDIKTEIEKIVNEAAKANHISHEFEVKDHFEDECSIFIPKEFIVNDLSSVMKLFDAVKICKCVKSVYFSNITNSRRGNGRSEFQIVVNEGCWYHTQEDAEKEEEEMRIYFDNEYAQKVMKKDREKKLKNWKEYLIPLPEYKETGSSEIYLTMAYEPYDLIESGEKTTEFRNYTELYMKRLFSHKIKTVRFQRGYGGPGHDKPKQMTWEVKKISLYDMETREETDVRNPKPIIPTHFAIDLGKRIK